MFAVCSLFTPELHQKLDEGHVLAFADPARAVRAIAALASYAALASSPAKAEALLRGARLDERLLRDVGEAAKGEVDPLTDHRGSAAYKREMTAVMVGRALTQAWEAARAMR